LDFSCDDFNYHTDNTISNERSANNLIILKKVKSIRFLKNTEKEWVRLSYKEAILKGFSLVNHIQCYIASKTKIWIERSGIEYLKKSEEEEDKKWYINLAKDHFAYVGVHRKAIDELEQCKKELWSMMADPEATDSEKVQMLRELHNLTKSCALFLRDLPFVANLTKYYDMNFFMENNKGEDHQKSLTSNVDVNSDEDLIEQKVSERLKKMMYESALFKSKEQNTTVSNTFISDNEITDDVSNEVQKQLNCNLKDVLESINNKDYQDSIRMLKEIREE
jgi:hypothetical protein